MKFSKDFDNYAREVNPFREFYRTQDSTFKTNIDSRYGEIQRNIQRNKNKQRRMGKAEEQIYRRKNIARTRV